MGPDTGSGAGTCVGLVVVHGIGDQQHGDTAREVLNGLDRVTTRPAGCDPPWTQEDPARDHIVVRRQLVPGGPFVELLVVDAWWDDVVKIESGLRRRLRTWLWGLRVVPLMLLLSAAAGMAAAMERSDRRVAATPQPAWAPYASVLTGTPRGTWGWLLRGLHSALLRFLVFPPFLFVALLVCLPLLQLADVVWRMLTRSGTSPPGRLLDLVLLLTCGDAWAFVGDPDRRERILQRVRNTFEWTRARCDSVVLVGHSQGGAISRALISTGAKADQLVTVGSGANLLGVLFNTARKPQVSIIAWVILLGYPAFVATLFTLFVQDVATYTSSIFSGFRDALAGRDGAGSFLEEALQIETRNILILIGFAVLFGVARLLIGRMQFDPSTLRPPISSWWDVSSRYDPVCVGGHVIEDGVHGVDVVNVTKPWQLPREHVAYFGNPAVAEVVAAALASAECGCYIEPTIRVPAENARWHRALTRYWCWGLPITLGAAFLVLRFYQWLASLVT